MRIRQQHLIQVATGDLVDGGNDMSSNFKTEVKSPSQTPSPLIHHSEQLRSTLYSDVSEANTAYLKPDFIDPLTSTKHESVCASPLAMLAKTCQNIGQMLEANEKSANVIQTTASSHMKTAATTCSPSNYVFVNHFTPTTTTTNTNNNLRMNRVTKKCNTNIDRQKISPQLNSLTDRFSWKRDVLPTSFILEQSATDRTETVSSSYSRICEKMFPYYPLQTGNRVPIQSTSSMSHIQSNPTPSTRSSFHHMTTNVSMSEPTTQSQTTSNALEQLAKLSSRLPVAESPPHRPQQNYSITNLSGKEKFNWVQPLRVQTGSKRTRRPTDPNYRQTESSSISPNKRISLNTSSPENKPKSYNEMEMWNKLSKAMETTTDDPQRIQSNDDLSQTLTRGFVDLFNRMISAQRPDYHEKPKNLINFQPSLQKIDTPTLPIPHPIELMSKINSIPDTAQQFSSAVSLQRCPICGNHYNNQFELCAHFYTHMIAAQTDHAKPRDNPRQTQNGMNLYSLENQPFSLPNFYHSAEHPSLPSSHNHGDISNAETSEIRYLSLLKFYMHAMNPQRFESKETIHRSSNVLNSALPEKSINPDANILEQKRMAEFELYSFWMRLLSSSYPRLHEAFDQTRQFEQQTAVFPPSIPSSSPHLLWSHLLNPTGSQVTVLPKV